MDDVRCLHHVARRRQHATMIVDSLLARHAAHRLADKMLHTSTQISRLADGAVDATVAMMWLGAHLDFPELPELQEVTWNDAPA